MGTDTPRTDKFMAKAHGKGWEDDALVVDYLEDFARGLERELNCLHHKARTLVEDYLKIPWGDDGDCGATRLINKFDCDIN